MKKIYLAVFLAFSMGAANAQISEGGLPWSMNLESETISSQVVAKVALPTPDYEKYAQEDLQDAITGAAKPYRVAATIKTDITLDDGTWFYKDNGDRIWRAKIEVLGAHAISLKYTEFFLPEGVKLYITNENQQQVLGAFTSNNNSKYNVFATHQVQGNISFLEMNVPASVNLGNVKFKIGEVYGYYRGAEGVQHYAFIGDVPAARPTLDQSASCHVNANCTPGMTEPYLTAKNATVLIFSNGGSCSGTLINSLGNLEDGVCKPYLLTASHCDGENSRDDAHYASWVFQFNYQYPYCDSARETPRGNFTLTGADFRARSNNPSFTDRENSLVLDILLLELTSPIPAEWNATLAGWNRRANLAELTEDYNFYIGFHHPGGDAKKLSTANSIEANGRFNQVSMNNTHWAIGYTQGGTAKGSSGSGLFDKNGLLIGDLSGGQGGSCPDGREFGIQALYSKFSTAWENPFDQATFPQYAGRQSRLKDWLDPHDVDILEFPSTKFDCSDLKDKVSVAELDDQLARSIDLYPNPSSGLVNVRLNLSKATDVALTVFDITGAQKSAYVIPSAYSNTYSMDLSNLPNGIYMVSVQAGAAITAKKVIISR